MTSSMINTVVYTVIMNSKKKMSLTLTFGFGRLNLCDCTYKLKETSVKIHVTSVNRNTTTGGLACHHSYMLFIHIIL